MKTEMLRNPVTPRVIFSASAFQKMLMGLDSKITKSKEIAWLGQVTQREDFVFVVDEIHYPPQTANSGTWVETDDKFGVWIAENFTTIPARKSLRMHGHSHPKMGVTPSGTDVQLFKELQEQNSDYFIRVIVNEDYDINCDMFIHSENCAYYGLPVEVEIVQDELYIRSIIKGNYKVYSPKGKIDYTTFERGFTEDNKYATLTHPSKHLRILKEFISDDVILVFDKFFIKNDELMLKECKELFKLIEDDLKEKIVPAPVVTKKYGTYGYSNGYSYYQSNKNAQSNFNKNSKKDKKKEEKKTAKGSENEINKTSSTSKQQTTGQKITEQTRLVFGTESDSFTDEYSQEEKENAFIILANSYGFETGRDDKGVFLVNYMGYRTYMNDADLFV